jgi:hypothetical protein
MGILTGNEEKHPLSYERHRTSTADPPAPEVADVLLQ